MQAFYVLLELYIVLQFRTEDDELYTEEAQEIDDNDDNKKFDMKSEHKRWQVKCLSVRNESGTLDVGTCLCAIMLLN